MTVGRRMSSVIGYQRLRKNQSGRDVLFTTEQVELDHKEQL